MDLEVLKELFDDRNAKGPSQKCGNLAVDK